jgi:hypothetical protein
MYDQEISRVDAPLAASLGFETLKAMMAQRVKDGWVWHEAAHQLAHPHDARLFFHIDPLTRRLSLSPELVQQVVSGNGADLRQEQP